MAIHPKFKKQKVTSGDLNTPVTFFEYQPSSGPEPGDEEKQELFSCMALVYNPSMKDLEMIQSIRKLNETRKGAEITGTKQTVTLQIRDPHGDYLPHNKHKAVVDDYRFKDKVWEIINVSNDLVDNRFIKIILEQTE